MCYELVGVIYFLWKKVKICYESIQYYFFGKLNSLKAQNRIHRAYSPYENSPNGDRAWLHIADYKQQETTKQNRKQSTKKQNAERNQFITYLWKI